MRKPDVTKPDTPYQLKEAPIHDEEIEKRALACALQFPEACDVLVRLGDAEDFYFEKSQEYFRAIRHVAEPGRGADPALVMARLNDLNLAFECRAEEVLQLLLNEVVPEDRMPRYLELLRGLRVRREVLDRARAFADRLKVGEDGPGDAIENMRRDLQRYQELLAAVAPGASCATAAEVAATLESVRWLWPGWVPLGALTLVAAAPGLGKSALALWLARCVTRPEPWPDGGAAPEPAVAIYCDTEANHNLLLDRARQWHTLERLLLPGQDGLSRLQFDDPNCLQHCRRWIREHGARLVVVDSLRTAFSGDENSSEVVEVLQPWVELAAREQVALVVVHHARKLQSGERPESVDAAVRGSSALSALARSIITLSRVKHGDGEMRLQVAKSNFAALPPPLRMRIHSDRCSFRADQVGVAVGSETERAVHVLRELLASGPLSYAEVERRAAQERVARTTLQRAAQVLGVESVVDPQNGRQRRWSLPGHHAVAPASSAMVAR